MARQESCMYIDSHDFELIVSSLGKSTFEEMDMQGINEVEGKVAIVTGAASGIGRAITQLLVARGASVVAEDIDPAVGALKGRRVVPLVADISADGSAEKAVALAIERFSRLDLLVNNAGIIINKLVVDMSRDDWERIINVNLTGAFLHSREAMKAMIPQRFGSIVNVASYASAFAFPTISAYAASKGALAQLTRTLALEAIEYGIRVNAVGSGDVLTNILDTVAPDGNGVAALDAHGKGAPIGRAADPKEIAEVVLFLGSERASFMVGSVVMADGGMSVKVGP